MIHHGHISRPHLGSALLAMGCVWLAAIPASAATFVVDSNGDAADASPGDGTCATAAGACTLRAAIEEHNALGGSNVIHFNLSPLAAIRPASVLPWLDPDLVIDGTTQPGYAGTPIVVLDGSNILNNGIGLQTSSNTVIRGLVITYWSSCGIVMEGTNVSVAGNYIGLNANGSTAQPNGNGICLFHAYDSIIGGPAAADRNVISGNTYAGIEGGSMSDRVTIRDNLIGTDPNGTRAIPNRWGIYCIQDQRDWVIMNNLVSGNTEFGVQFNGWRGGVVLGNYIGTDITGSYAIPNNPLAQETGYGIHVFNFNADGAAGPIVGGTGAGEGNLISGNGGAGLVAGYNTLVMGNYVGTTAEGQGQLSNLGYGIKPVDPTTVIGGTTPGAGNLIAYNTRPGIGGMVDLRHTPIVRGNSVHSNGGLGIDWHWVSGPDGPTAPYPLLTQALAGGNRVSGTLSGMAANTPFTIDYYSNSALDPTAHGEGETWVGWTTVLTDGAGAVSFDVSLGTPLVAGRFITATATGTLEGTTEFSQGLEVTDGCLPGSGPCCDAGGQYLPAGTECRAAAGPCDAAEVCLGASADCPADAFLPAGTDCRAAAGDCDAAEACAGDSATCPADLLLPDTVACRPAAGACDLAERCTGLTPACPPDDLQPVTTECRAASCLDGLETDAARCTGTSATCPAPAARACAPYACGAEACQTTCGTSADCAPGFACDAGVCRSPGGLGDPCLAAAECQSAHCVDGVCCDAPCTGQCEACDTTGALGACVPVLGAPHGARTPCASDGGACGGACDGTGICAYPGAETACREASCAGDVATLAAACQGTGACPAAQTQDCGPSGCDGDRCAGGCVLDGDCPDGSYCAAGVCVGKRELGDGCAGDHQCASGHCADAVCCDGACAGQCEACDLLGSQGTCSPVTGAPHGGHTACEGLGACAGSCDGTERLACVFPSSGTVCAEAACESFLARPAGTCDGQGACSLPEAVSCLPYACGEGACLTSCQSDADCAGGHQCEEGACLPFEAPSGCGCGASGGAGGLGALLLLAGLAVARRRR